MPFSSDERKKLLSVKGIGPKVIERLEQMGIESFAQLEKANVQDVVSTASMIVGSSCWKNSPQAHAAIEAAIFEAKRFNSNVAADML